MPEISASDSFSQRRLMVDGQIRTFGITDLDLIDRFMAVPRENFVDPLSRALAWSDAQLYLPGSPRRLLLAPMVLAKMIQSAGIKPSDHVLDVAGGLGYGAAILAGLCVQVVALEDNAGRVAAAKAAFATLGLANAVALSGELAQGAPVQGQFDVIIVNGAVEAGLDTLLGQLRDGGRLVAIRNLPGQALGTVVRSERHGSSIGERVLFETIAPVLQGFAAAPAFAF